MSNKWDEDKPDTNQSIQTPETLSGSNVNVNPAPNVPKVKQENLVMSVEEYTKILTEAQRAALREQRISRFPNLFDVRGFDEDILSKHPWIEMSNAAKLYTSLFEVNLKEKLERIRNKVSH